MAKSRTQKVITNVSASLINNLVSLISGLIIPRLIISNFGSAYNGMTQSISQFISYISLMQAGIGGATTAALYKPIAENDTKKMSEILASTQKFMRKISLIYVIFVSVVACVYPIWIAPEYDWFFSASLIVIISMSTFAQYYFGFTYQCLLSADQKGYIGGYLGSVTIVLDAIVSVVLINGGCSIHMVKLGASVVHIISPLFIYFYVRNRYDIDAHAKPKVDMIPQKWNAAAHEVADFVNNNTDVVILSMFASLEEVSVYGVYHYVTMSIKKIVTNFTVGFAGAFGDMYAKNEIDAMNKNLGIYEVIIYSLTTIFCSVTLVMMIPFVLLYTKGVNDINYSWPVFSAVLTFACAFNCFRVPYRSIVYAVGKYKETRNGAIFEAVMNIVVSVIGVIKFGLVGVALGTLCAMTFRTCQYAIYLTKDVMYRDVRIFIKHIITSFVTMIIVYFVAKIYTPIIDTWFKWFLYATITSLLTIAIVITFNKLFFNEDYENFKKKIFGILKKKLNK